MIKKSITVLLTLLCIVSCSKEIPFSASDTPVVFKEDKVGTKTSGIITSSNISTMGIWGYYSQDQDFNGSSESGDVPNYMFCQKAEKVVSAGDSSWIYSPLKYWPNMPNHRISFFAFAPYGGEEIGIKSSSSNKKGYPYIDFTVQEEAKNQIDLLLGQPHKNMTYNPSLMSNPNIVGFTFTHVLSKVRFAAQSIKIDSLRIAGVYGKGRIGYSDTGLVWSNFDYHYDFSLMDTLDFAIAPDGSGLSTESGSLMMIPQSGTVSLTISYQTLTAPVKVVVGETASFDFTWERGKSYKYTLSIKDNKLVITIRVEMIGNESDDWVHDEFNEEIVGE